MNDKMELEEAIKILNELKEEVTLFSTGWKNKLKDDEKQAIEIVLQALESYKERYELAIEQNVKDYKNSIPKKKIENKIKAYEKLIEDVSESEQYSHEIPLYRHDIQVIKELLEDK